MQVAHGDSDVDAASRALAQRTWPALKRSTKAGVRRTVRPTGVKAACSRFPHCCGTPAKP